ncbi:tetratricopeptide repeat protein [Puniceicoccaceae bacterium K14]|nr:tetratricopeptide repeat protein [Puniceicoccaceae bacterium K14]
MTKNNILKSTIAGLACLAGTATMSAQIEYDRAEFWNQDHIKESFLYTYQYDPETEPELSEEDKTKLREVLPIVQTDKELAFQMLLDYITPESSAAISFLVGNFYAEDGDTDEALKYYETSVKKFPNYQRAHKNIAFMYVQAGDFEKGITSLTKAITLGVNESTVYGLLGLSYVNTANFISAETAYRLAIILNPSINDWRVGLAKALLSQGKYQESIAVLEEILTIDPENDIIWSSQANAYLGTEELDLAVANQEIVARMGKATPETLNFMGNIYLSKGLSDLALENYQKAITMDPNQDVSTYIDIASIMVGRGFFEKSSVLIKKIRNDFGELSRDEEISMLRLQSRIALATGEAEEAVPILEKLVENDPLDGQALILLAEHYSGLDTSDGYSRADLYYQRAVKVQEEEVRALISWARSYVAREHFGKAIPKLERANQLDPKEYISRYLEQVRMINRTKVGG